MFISFDYDHDRVVAKFLGQQLRQSPRFQVENWSMKEAAPQRLWKEEARSRINRSDVVLVVVGKHTHRAPGVLAEVQMARMAQPPVPIRQIIGYRLLVGATRVPNAGRLYRWRHDRLETSSRYHAGMPPEDQPPDPSVLELLNKQLDRYQAVISRLANNQVQVKTWCVTALAALAALAVNNDQQGPLVIALVVVIAFFFLDAYYLSLERHFRGQSHRAVEEVFASGESPSWAELFRMEGSRARPATGLASRQEVRSVACRFAVLPWAASHARPRIPPVLARVRMKGL